jgi:hypothetical protein
VIAGNLQSKALLARAAWAFRRSTRFPLVPFAAPAWVSGPDMSDNWSFWHHGYPALMVTDTSFLRNPHYHKPTDRPETLHYPAMTKVVGGVAAVIARLAG